MTKWFFYIFFILSAFVLGVFALGLIEDIKVCHGLKFFGNWLLWMYVFIDCAIQIKKKNY